MPDRPIGLWRRLCCADSGAALVEFAITAPLLVLLALGAADYGTITNNGTSLAGATRAVAEFARNTAECAGGGLANSDCITEINSFVSTLQSNDTSLSSASFELPNYPISGTTSTVPLPAPSASTPSANYCTCTDGTVVTCPTSGNPCSAKADPRLLQYIKITAALTVTPLISFAKFTFPSLLNAQTTTRIQ